MFSKFIYHVNYKYKVDYDISQGINELIRMSQIGYTDLTDSYILT